MQWTLIFMKLRFYFFFFFFRFYFFFSSFFCCFMSDCSDPTEPKVSFERFRRLSKFPKVKL